MEYRPSPFGNILGYPLATPNVRPTVSWCGWMSLSCISETWWVCSVVWWSFYVFRPFTFRDRQIYLLHRTPCSSPKMLFSQGLRCFLCLQISDEPNSELWFREDGCAGPWGLGDFPKPWRTVLVWRCGCCLLNSLPYLFVTYVSVTSLILSFVVFFGPQFIFFSKLLKWVIGRKCG